MSAAAEQPWPPRSPTGCPSSSTPTRWRTSTGPLGVARRAHPARRRARRDARRRPARTSRPPAGATPGAAAERYDASCCSRAGTPWSPSPDGRVRVTTTGVPWLATAGAGDVLAGLVGALLAAGLDPFDAASVGRLAARRRRDRWPRPAGPWWPATWRGAARRDRRQLPCLRQVPRAVGTASGDGRIGPWSPGVGHARRDRGRPRRDPAQRARIAARAASAPAALMTVVKADGYGHGMVPGRPGRPRGRRAVARRRHRRRGARAAARAGDTGRILCLARPCPGEDVRRRRSRQGIDVTAYSRRRARRDRRRRARPRAAAARCSSRSTPACPAAAAPMPDWPALVAEARRLEASGRRSGSPGSGRTSPAATSPTTPPTTPRSGSSGRRSRRRRGRRARARGAPPGQLRRRRCCGPRSRFDLVRCRARVATASTRHPGRTARPRPGPGDDGAGPAGHGQADPRRCRRLLRPHLGRRPRRPRVGLVPVGYGDGRARAHASSPRRGAGRRAAPPGPRPDLHGPVRRRPRGRPARARRPTSCCSARAPTASPPPRTGPRPATRSATRS